MRLQDGAVTVRLRYSAVAVQLQHDAVTIRLRYSAVAVQCGCGAVTGRRGSGTVANTHTVRYPWSQRQYFYCIFNLKTRFVSCFLLGQWNSELAEEEQVI